MKPGLSPCLRAHPFLSRFKLVPPSYNISCVCRRISGGDLSAEMLYFNTTSAMCQNVTENFRPTAEAALVESTFTRYSQKEVRARA